MARTTSLACQHLENINRDIIEKHQSSLAGQAVAKRPGCNGWVFWRYERAPGDWVKLREIRK